MNQGRALPDDDSHAVVEQAELAQLFDDVKLGVAVCGTDAMRRVARLGPALIRVREHGEHSIDMAIAALHGGYGGLLVIEQPLTLGGLTEINYATDGFGVQLGRRR